MTDLLMALPMWLVYVLLALPVLTAGTLLLTWALCRASAWADRKVDEVLVPPVSVLDDFAAMGEQVDNVSWIFGDERPQLTVIDGGSEEVRGRQRDAAHPPTALVPRHFNVYDGDSAHEVLTQIADRLDAERAE